MDKELQQALAALISKGTSAAEAGAAFLQAELPEVIRQLLVWKASEAGVWAAIQFAAVVGVVFGCRAIKRWLGPSEWDGGEIIFVPAIGSLIGLSFVFCAIFNVIEVLQILIAPKIYLIEYAASLAK